MSGYEKIIESYQALVDRAIKVAGAAPYCKYISNSEFAYIEFVGINAEEIRLCWPDLDYGWYNDTCVEPQVATFPSELLFLGNKELDKWQKEQKKIYDKKQKELRIEAQKANAKNERNLYEKLKKKYG